MTLDKKLNPYFWLDFKPYEIESEYFFTQNKLTKTAPVKKDKMFKLIKWGLGFCFLLIINFKNVLADDENKILSNSFMSLEQGLFYFLLFIVWAIFVIASIQLKGISGRPVGVYAIIQLCIGLVLFLNFLQFSWLISIGVLGATLITFIGCIT